MVFFLMTTPRVLFLYILFLLLVPHTLIAQTNRALVVAISNYPSGSEWGITNALNDVALLRQMLQQKGFASGGTTFLLNEQATRKGVVDQLRKMERVAGKGDYIYIHFSCHGQQMFDDNGDEEDGYDEAFVLYHAQRKYEEGVYEGEEHLRDDELGEWLDKIRQKIGLEGNVTVLLDACHSATGARRPKNRYLRGTAYPFAPKNYKTPPADPARWKNVLTKGAGLAPVHVFSACKETEANFEYFDSAANKSYGFLTFVFSALMKEDNKGMTYQSFAEKLLNRVAILLKQEDVKQTPTLETTHGARTFNISR
ncbi:caspase family protein [Bacteroides sp. 224]|uniref:caspase family protein n=1 Tax=Bacteroides sp. 224 TaxID=2302936 RepID=UPI0013D04D07|nr:caspase family protein [Bacteroides sp. 224]NDV65371.1 caspase family protein [Bacteroides sp. 224]